MQTINAGTGEQVARSDLVRSFQVTNGGHILLDKEDFESVKFESMRIVDIEKFVPRESINHYYWRIGFTTRWSSSIGAALMP